MDSGFNRSFNLDSFALQGNGISPRGTPSSLSPFGDLSQLSLEDDDDLVSRAAFGVATDSGGRPYQDDRSMAFSTRLDDGTRITVCAILDGHHGSQLADYIAGLLPTKFLEGLAKSPTDIETALAATIRSLDDAAFQAHKEKWLTTGGTTIIVHALVGNALYTANVGDCKAMLSSRGAPEPLSEAHNPPVETEKQRFEAAGIDCFSDHIGGSDINVCRTLGDYDLGPPLKYRIDDADGTSGVPCGPLTSDPEISVRILDAIDEFLVVGTDGLWDYYTPDSSVVTEARRRLRAVDNDPQAAAEWLVEEALQRQRSTLHSGTPGDNVTVMVIRLRRLPAIPRASASRLNLRRVPSDSDT